MAIITRRQQIEGKFTCIDTVMVPESGAFITSTESFEIAGLAEMSPTFKREYLGLKVPEVGDLELLIYPVPRLVLDLAIMEEFGGDVETPVSSFSTFLAREWLYMRKREWLVFYLRGKDRILRPVSVSGSSTRSTERGGTWTANARGLNNPSGWPVGYKVVVPKK